MKIDQIQYILEIAKQGSINKAAKSLMMTQPNLSASVRSLEKEMGFEIFIRTNKGIELTSKGIQLLEHAKSISASYSAITDLSDNQNKNVNNDISLSISAQFFSPTLYALMEVFEKNSARSIDFKIKQTTFSEIVTDVRTGHSDIGFISVDLDQKNLFDNILDLNGLEYVHLADIAVCAYLSKKHPLADQDRVTIDDLLRFPLVISNFTVKEFLYSSFLSKIQFDQFRQKIQVDDYYSLMVILNELNAVTYTISFPNMNAFPHFLNSSVGVFKKLDWDEENNYAFGYIKPASSILSPTATNFLNIIKESISHDSSIR